MYFILSRTGRSTKIIDVEVMYRLFSGNIFGYFSGNILSMILMMLGAPHLFIERYICMKSKFLFVKFTKKILFCSALLSLKT